MKSTIIPALLLSILLSSCDNELAPANVPEVVKNGLASQFPDVWVLEWEAINQYYVAEFNIENLPYEVKLDRDGNIIMYKYDIRPSRLPEAVKTTIRNKYSAVPVANAEILHHKSKKYYQVAFDDEFRDYWLVFSEDGQRLDQPEYMR